MSETEDSTQNKQKPKLCKKCIFGGFIIMFFAIIGVISTIQWIITLVD
jgi:hypothetical protein